MRASALRAGPTERRSLDPLLQSGVRRHTDRETGMVHVKIGPGDYYVTKANEMLALLEAHYEKVAILLRDELSSIPSSAPPGSMPPGSQPGEL